MLIKQVVSHKSLLESGTPRAKIRVMSTNLVLFPTPFKKIYYLPSPEERKATTIDKPTLVLTRAIAAYLGTDQFYYSCRTAEEFFAIKWQPIGEVHVINTKLSRKINLEVRTNRNLKKNNYRAKRIADILSIYGRIIIFHKVKSIAGAKFKRTPYGAYALRSQIRKDKKRFRERMD
ncbi:MAG: hypothetical protein AABW86_00245 [Candidatus Micrarchaeota archaeon]